MKNNQWKIVRCDILSYFSSKVVDRVLPWKLKVHKHYTVKEIKETINLLLKYLSKNIHFETDTIFF